MPTGPGQGFPRHLGNGAHALLPRHRNPIQKQLSMDGLMASLIADGIHLPGYVVKNFIRAKGIERVILTTDSMAGAGAPPGIYTIGDLEVEVGPRSHRAPSRHPLSGRLDAGHGPGREERDPVRRASTPLGAENGGGERSETVSRSVERTSLPALRPMLFFSSTGISWK